MHIYIRAYFITQYSFWNHFIPCPQHTGTFVIYHVSDSKQNEGLEDKHNLLSVGTDTVTSFKIPAAII